MEQAAIRKVVIDDDWRRWIAENLSLDAEPQGLFQVMVANGVAAEDAARELQLALASPYLRGALQASSRMKNRLKKHDWILDIHRTLNRQTPNSEVVERRHQLSRDEFYLRYYLGSKPVIITGMLDDWPAMSKWNFAYFKDRVGDRLVQVQTGRSNDANYELNSSQHRQTIAMREYVQMIETAGVTNDFYMTANNTSSNRVALTELWQDIGRIPEYLDPASPDDGFLWFGPAGTRTPFHHDLTNNFMCQVIGRKRVKLIPSCELPYVYNNFHCYTPVDGYQIDYDKYPLMRNVQILDCELGPGDILFIPVGCWHYVEGLDASVTVSFINFQLNNDFSTFYSTYHEV
jgi:ribosomal protein L16 Arg81 hydroxylase